MFKAECDGTLFYMDNSPSDLVHLVNPKLTLEANNVSRFEFTMPPMNQAYSTMECLTSFVTVYREDEIWFEGLVASEKTDFYNQRTITCEGELAFLARTTQPQIVQIFGSIRQYMDYLLAVHNAKILDDRMKIQIGSVTVTDPTIADRYTVLDFDNTLKYISELVETYGGYLRIRRENGVKYLDYLADFPHTSSQQIVFGKNLLDYTKEYNRSDFCTVIVPLGMTKTEMAREAGEEIEDPNEREELEGEQRLTIESVNDNSPYLVSSAYETYGWIERTVIFEDISDPDELKEAGINYLQNIQFDDMCLEVQAFDLSYTNKKEVD